MTARYDKLGAVTVPVVATVATGASLASYCDPALTNLVAAFKSILLTKLDPAWAKACQKISAHVVVGSYVYEPVRPAAQITWHWPALFMWRTTEKLYERTQVWDVAETTGKLAYILPPLPLALQLKIAPIRTAVRTVLHEFIEQHGDPEYASGASPITANSLESFRFVSAQYGELPSVANLEMSHLMLELTWEMRERQSFVADNYQSLTAIYTTVAVVTAGTGTTSTHLLRMYWP